MLIRDATPDDASAIASLRLAWADERGDTTEAAKTYAAGLATWIESHAETVVGKLAQRDDGHVVAMGWLAVVDRVPVPTRHDRKTGDIQSVFVLPEYRRTGIASDLLDALVEEARSRGLSKIVLQSSTAGAKFYRRIGWNNSELLFELSL